MAETLDLSLFVQRLPDGRARIEFALEGVTSPESIGEVEGALADIPGLTRARLNYTTHRLVVEWLGDEFAPSTIVERLDALGYRAHVHQPKSAEEDERRQSQWLLRCLGVAGFAAMNVMLLAVSVWAGNVTDITPETRDFFHWIAAIIALPAAAYAGQPFFRSAVAGLRTGRMNMDVPISLGVLLALGMSVVETVNHAQHTYFDSALMLLFFLLSGRYLDQAMRRRTRAVATNLASLKADVAHRIGPDGDLALVPVAALKPGDRVSVRPGDRVPVDGVVVAGSSEIDESLITGETALRRLGQGAAVYAGTISHSGALTVEVGAAGSGTLLDEIERLLTAAADARSGYVQLADRAARLYAPVVHTAAILTLVGWMLAGTSFHDATIIAISVLIITCPCALALAVPAVQAVASGALFRANIFLGSGDAIERLASVDTVVFDKTGTLTRPEPRIANAAQIDPDLVALAARLALSSRHPLAVALASEAVQRTPFEDVREEAGQGVCTSVGGIEARLGSLAFCGIEGGPDIREDISVVALRYGARTAVFEIAQALRPDAIATVEALRARGLDLRILSGDRPQAVAAVAARLGIHIWQAGANPAQKIALLDELKSAGRKVLMVGDGVNDAPALAAASASMSPISAADIAQANADCVFLGDSLAPVETALAVSRKARRLMHGNLWLAVVYNAFAVPLAVSGHVTPLIAALAMSGSSIIVTVNALRARRPSRPAAARASWPALPLQPVAARD